MSLMQSKANDLIGKLNPEEPEKKARPSIKQSIDSDLLARYHQHALDRLEQKVEFVPTRNVTPEELQLLLIHLGSHMQDSYYPLALGKFITDGVQTLKRPSLKLNGFAQSHQLGAHYGWLHDGEFIYRGEVLEFGECMTAGTLRLEGTCLSGGSKMQGGRLYVAQASSLGSHMSGGFIEGRANHCGGSMSGGTIVITGDVRERAGDHLKEGTITIHGGAQYVGENMSNGTIEIMKDADAVGKNMRGGTIIVRGKIAQAVGFESRGGSVYAFGNKPRIAKHCRAKVYYINERIQ